MTFQYAPSGWNCTIKKLEYNNHFVFLISKNYGCPSCSDHMCSENTMTAYRVKVRKASDVHNECTLVLTKLGTTGVGIKSRSRLHDTPPTESEVIEIVNKNYEL